MLGIDQYETTPRVGDMGFAGQTSTTRRNVRSRDTAMAGRNRHCVGPLRKWPKPQDSLMACYGTLSAFGGARFHVHIHAAPFLLRHVRIDMSHPIQDDRNPQSLRRLARTLRCGYRPAVQNAAFGPNCSLSWTNFSGRRKSPHVDARLRMLNGAIASSFCGDASTGAVYITPTAVNPSAVRLYKIEPGRL